MASMRCTQCETLWPSTKAYDQCPECQAKCNYAADDPEFDFNEARERAEGFFARRRRNAEFERYYEERAVAELHRELDSLAW